jgi:hypothetical protein
MVLVVLMTADCMVVMEGEGEKVGEERQEEKEERE